MKKCLIVTTHYKPLIGGAQTVYDALASAKPDEISILTAYKNYVSGEVIEGWEAHDKALPYQITRLAEIRPRLLNSKSSILAKLVNRWRAAGIRKAVLSAILKQVQQDQIDCVCIGALDALGWLIYPLKKKLHIPIILYTHGEEISQQAYSHKADRDRAAALNAADGVIAVSRFTAGLLSEKYGVSSSRVITITNGVYAEHYQPPYSVDVREYLGLRSTPLVLAMGRLVARKGFDRLLEAWPLVRKALPGAILAIAGTGGQQPYLHRQALAKEQDSSVHMLGRIEDDVVPALYAAADLFVMPNRTLADGDTEGFGLVFLEAAAAGTPSIGGDAGGVPDAILDGETGVLVDGTQPEQIAKAIIDLLSNDKKRQALSRAAQAHALRQNWQVKADEFMKFVSGLCEDKQS